MCVCVCVCVCACMCVSVCAHVEVGAMDSGEIVCCTKRDH